MGVSVLPVRRALLSVWDKTGLEVFATRLVRAGVELVSSGGTARALAEAELPVVSVEEVTGAAEILGGRVKTLHPAVHAGVLADLRRAAHREDLERAGIRPFELVVVNLYPFAETAARGAEPDEVVEMIDIGGPALLRAAAKNHAAVGVVSDPSQYEEVVEGVEAGGLDEELRRRLAREAFFRTAAYDAAIVEWLEGGEVAPERLVLPLERHEVLRYGENPHQEAARYRTVGRPGWWEGARQIQGKQLSFNNLVDAEAAWRLASALEGPGAVVVKHTNPCGAAERSSLPEAYRAAWDCDPVSGFGGVVAVNRPLDGETASAMAEVFLEVVVAPEVTEAARKALAARSGLRLLELPPPEGDGRELRFMAGGVLAQASDPVDDVPEDRSVMVGELSQTMRADLRLAWRVAAHAKSNAVVVARDRSAVGVGAGDQSRVGAAERAVRKAGDRAHGAVAAGDAFFPFRDGLDVLADAGVVAVMAPGGSRRDEEVVAAARERGVVLVLAERRHFRH